MMCIFPQLKCQGQNAMFAGKDIKTLNFFFSFLNSGDPV